MKIKEVSSFHHLLIFLLISCSYFQYYYSEGCHEEERRALLQIKDSINKTESYMLSTWVGKDCCTWYGIDCNNSTSRVERLHLMDVREGDANAWYLNWTLLNSLKELRWLDLSRNKIDGNRRDMLQSMGSLKELRHLNLSRNEMGGNGTEFLQVVCHLSLIEHLSVGYNSLEGVVPPCLGNLTSLTILALSYNKFQGNLPSLNRLNALETLSLYSNQFQGSILNLFGENQPIRKRDAFNFSNATTSPPWKKLKALYLGYNELTGDGWDLAQVVCHLSLIDTLSVASNSLEGVVPPCLGNLTSLTFLDLSKNQFHGNIPSLNRLNALETLGMSYNQFQGSILNLFGENQPIRMRDAFNFSNATISPPWKKLKALYLGFNELTGDGWDLAQVVCQLSLLEILVVTSNSLEGVVHPCLDNLTSLIRLDLSQNKFQGNIPSLSHLNALESLDLSNNQFQGNILYLFGGNHPIRMKDASNFSNATKSLPWKKLQLFDLGDNELIGDGWDLAQVVCHLSLIDTLSVASNSLEGVVPPCLGNLTSLTFLDLSKNQFHGNIPSLNRLNALETLGMSYNQFQGSILNLFGENQPIRMRDAFNFSNATISPPWKKLKALYLGFNELTGDGWDLAQVVCQLSLLEILVVTSNSLEGVVHPCLDNLTSLIRLDLSQNKFQGNIPSLSHLNALESLDLSNNQFQGNILYLFGGNHPIRMKDASNFSNATKSLPWKKLQLFDLGDNELIGDGWDLAQVVCHLSLIDTLSVASNSLEGVVPPCLGNLTSLTILILSHNQFQGNIPSLSRLNALQYISLDHNQFQGNILHLFEQNYPIRMRDASNFSNATISPPWKKLQKLELGYNELTGDGWDLAQAICQLKSLKVLDLSHNSLGGRLHPCLGMMHSISLLNLSYNGFQGNVPPISDGFNMNKSSLVYLDLSYNRLEGDILPGDSNMSELRVLMLQNNRFTRLTALPRLLIYVDLRHNHLSGDIYSASLPLPRLRALLFGGNHLEGKIPKQLCEMKFLHFIDLSQNNLSGKIPSCLNNISSMRDKYLLSNERPIEIPISLTPIRFFNVSISYVNATIGFTTKGRQYTFEGSPLNFFTGIDLSCNQFIGGIPSEIGDLRNLHALNLSNNRLVGSFPTSFQNMENIESLDLSYNELSGPLPLQLTELHLLAIFNVSFNNLSGSIPFNQQFSTFKEDSFMGNVGLCGPQIKTKCSNNTALGHIPPQPNFDDEDGAASLIENRLFFYSWVAISYALGLWVVIGLLIFSKNRRQKYFKTIDEYIYTSQEKFWILLNYFKVCN